MNYDVIKYAIVWQFIIKPLYMASSPVSLIIFGHSPVSPCLRCRCSAVVAPRPTTWPRDSGDRARPSPGRRSDPWRARDARSASPGSRRDRDTTTARVDRDSERSDTICLSTEFEKIVHVIVFGSFYNDQDTKTGPYSYNHCK